MIKILFLLKLYTIFATLRRGIYVDRIYDIGRIENVHWNPWWSMKPAVYNFQKQNGEAFIFERTDWHYVLNTFCFGY